MNANPAVGNTVVGNPVALDSLRLIPPVVTPDQAVATGSDGPSGVPEEAVPAGPSPALSAGDDPGQAQASGASGGAAPPAPDMLAVDGPPTLRPSGASSESSRSGLVSGSGFRPDRSLPGVAGDSGRAASGPSNPAATPAARAPLAPIVQAAPAAGDTRGSGVLGDSRLAAAEPKSDRGTSGRGASGTSEAPAPAPVPIPDLPDQGSSPAAGAAGHGGASSGGALMALLAAFIFSSPGLAQWLRVGTERRPRLLRAGRHERPG
jgi:hypothetical protein